MTIAVKHAFVSLKGDGTDTTQVQPSNWNASHSITCATGVVLGRASAGAGTVEELPATTNGLAVLNSADASSYGFTTGDLKSSLKSAPDTGWVPLNGSIGNAASSATTRANADTQALFLLLYANVADSTFPVSGGRSGNALNDFNAGKRLDMSAAAGRVHTQAQGFGVLGAILGEATHTLVATEIPSIASSGTASVNSTPSNVLTGNPTTTLISGGSGAPFQAINPGTTGVGTLPSTGSASVTSTNTGGQPHNNYQPSINVNVFVKL